MRVHSVEDTVKATLFRVQQNYCIEFGKFKEKECSSGRAKYEFMYFRLLMDGLILCIGIRKLLASGMNQDEKDNCSSNVLRGSHLSRGYHVVFFQSY